MRQSANGAHGVYADEQLIIAQKRMFITEFLPCDNLLFIKGGALQPRNLPGSARFFVFMV